jgi:hypothetical protein
MHLITRLFADDSFGSRKTEKYNFLFLNYIQSVPGGNFNILGSGSIGNCEIRSLYKRVSKWLPRESWLKVRT